MNGQNKHTAQNVLIVSIAIISTGIGIAIGNSLRGKAGATVGGIVGAIAGSLAGCAIAEFEGKETHSSNRLGLGADTKNVELPAHYSWDELKALSQPQLNLHSTSSSSERNQKNVIESVALITRELISGDGNVIR